MFSYSVVIPVFNREWQLCRALDSVLSQTLAPAEIIVIDDGSAEFSLQELKKQYPSVRFVTQNHTGVSSARNRGINIAKCEWIAFLDSDDEWMLNKMELQSEWLVSHPEHLICHCDEIWIRNGVRVNPKNKHRKSGGWIYLDCLPLCVISPSATVINKDIFDKIGLFDEDFPVCEDYDMWLRIACQYRVGYVEYPLLIKYGGHHDQLSKAYTAMDQYRIKALVKMLKTDVLVDEHRRETLAMMNKKISVYANGAEKRGKLKEALKYRSVLLGFDG